MQAAGAAAAPPPQPPTLAAASSAGVSEGGATAARLQQVVQSLLHSAVPPKSEVVGLMGGRQRKGPALGTKPVLAPPALDSPEVRCVVLGCCAYMAESQARLDTPSLGYPGRALRSSAWLLCLCGYVAS